MSIDDQSDKNRRPEEPDLELAKSLVKKENKKATAWFLLFLVVIAILNVLVALNRNSISNKQKRIDNAEYMERAMIGIDREYDRLDSIISALPKPSKRNYEECYARVSDIKWRYVETRGIQELKDYQTNKREAILNRLNDYIYKMQGIESRCLSGNESTMSDYDVITYEDPDGETKTATISKRPNPKFMELRKLSDL